MDRGGTMAVAIVLAYAARRASKAARQSVS
jgi:hypothetical protein